MLGLSAAYWALVATLLPAVAALLIGVVVPLRRAGRPAAFVSIATAGIAVVAAIFALLTREASGPVLELWRWLPSSGTTLAEVGAQLDGISGSMLLVVTIVAFCVQVFSLGYMSDEPPAALGRYFAYHSLFIFSMNTLVIAPNLLQLFIGWELVGLTSYLLIGFYYQKPSAARAAVKAFWFTKFADMGLLIALIALLRASGGFSWDAPLPEATATLITLGLFVAVMGKSAQFPLHVWLPDAMEGPTPVSALLHAATMVAAGVFLVVRVNPLFIQAPDTLTLMAYVGAFTALFAACIAVVQTDIKRVLAYSTCSQLGYMVTALGAGSIMGGYFHLTTHAFFKALLFLGAGSVIHAVHSNELSDMGGLLKKMPVTGGTFIVGALALAGVAPLAGFFSKDLILEAVAARGLWLPLVALIIAAGLTAFYMGRVVFLAFFGKPAEKAKHAHEHGISMSSPLVLLAILSIVVGFFGGAFATLYEVDYSFHIGAVGIVATLIALGSIVLAWAVYGPKGQLAWLPDKFAPVGGLARSGAIDIGYAKLYRHGFVGFARAIAWLDRYVIDGLMNLLGWLTIRGGQRIRKVQTGNVLDYVYAVVAGAVVLAVWGLFK